MADGKWTMTDEDAKRVDLSFRKTERLELSSLPNFGKHLFIDNRNNDAEIKCAFCNSKDLQSGFGGLGDGFGYKSFKCTECGATTDFVYKDDEGSLIGTEV